MEPNLDQDRRKAHALIDALPAEKLSAIKSLLEVIPDCKVLAQALLVLLFLIPNLLEDFFICQVC